MQIEIPPVVPPYWISEPKDVAVLLSHPLAVDCRAGGQPTPNVTWYRLAPGNYSRLPLPHLHGGGRGNENKSINISKMNMVAILERFFGLIERIFHRFHEIVLGTCNP